ncbi:hypothetical protein SPI_03785 [Niveomyces insectorum RCEF 264]|uniref:Uncharacterized protein n=1 Tax=Niveomyces insectorum RCEF 264 TaxID=1081102 RepID=A0A162J4L2_9HYPO|nr:hypothetical protein SPI_03785 [Niveomyces insectorum RCEF 264]
MERYQYGISASVSSRVNETNENVRTLHQKVDEVNRRLYALTHELKSTKPRGFESPLINPSQTEVDRLKDENRGLRVEISKLRGIVTQSRRRDDGFTDDTIERHVLELKNGIFQFVRNHMSQQTATIDVPRGSSPDLRDLVIQSKVASALYARLFSEDAPYFGISPASSCIQFDSGLREFEMQLKTLGCNDDELRNWRVATLRLSAKLVFPSENDEDTLDSLASDILANDLGVDSIQGPWGAAALTELAQVCAVAYELAAKFRASNIEYKWEQGTAPPASALPGDKAFEVVGIEGSENINERHQPFAATCIVFGGVIRGDRTTGTLRDGTIRLTPSSVVKRGDW